MNQMKLQMSTGLVTLILVLAGLSAPGNADERDTQISDEYGTSNPEELSLRGALDRLRHGEAHPMLGVLGYGAAKAGMHEEAREIFTDSAERGNVQGITWLSWMEDNGLAGPE
ncbi:MAG: hypothetical protein ACPGVJ_09390, partial [Mangrovicoccus sp.]